jgi:hypothetical protein
MGSLKRLNVKIRYVTAVGFLENEEAMRPSGQK